VKVRKDFGRRHFGVSEFGTSGVPKTRGQSISRIETPKARKEKTGEHHFRIPSFGISRILWSRGSEHFGNGKTKIAKGEPKVRHRYFNISRIRFLGVQRTGGRALRIYKTPNRTAVI
jgi:hypothetical protein